MKPSVNCRLLTKLCTRNSIASIHLSQKSCLTPTAANRTNVRFPPNSSVWHQPNKSIHLFAPLRKELVEFKLADIGEGINEVIIKEWYVKVGDEVRQFDSICEVQSDKASVTITSRFDGKITKLFYEPEQTAIVGKPLVQLQVQTGKMVDELNDQDAQASISAGNLSLVKNEERFNQTGANTTNINGQHSISLFNPFSVNSEGNKVLTTPAVRKMAAEHGINLHEVQATGKEGRILKEDVLRHLEEKKQTSAEQTRTSAAQSLISKDENKTKVSNEGKQLEAAHDGLSSMLQTDQVHKLKGIQKAMAKSMTASLRIPHLGLADEIVLTYLVKLRHQLNKQTDHGSGVRLSYLPFFIKAASLALKQFPMLNATFNADKEELTYKASHNIGVAIDSPAGLLVPNIKNVQNLSIVEIAHQLNNLQKLASKNQLTNSDLTGGTFTLSNIGSIGGSFGIPVILSPEVAIGALGRIQDVPRFNEEDNVVKVQVLNVVWSADHRVIDGATMTRFNNVWKSYLENPLLMITDLK